MATITSTESVLLEGQSAPADRRTSLVSRLRAWRPRPLHASAVVTGVVALTSFEMSFAALHDLSVRNLVAPALAANVPIAIDGLVIGSIIATATFKRRSSAWWYATALFVFWTLVSVAGNIEYAREIGGSPVSLSLYAGMPLTMLFAVHLTLMLFGRGREPAVNAERAPATQVVRAPAMREVHTPATQVVHAPATQENRPPAAKEDRAPAAQADWAPATGENHATAMQENPTSATQADRTSATQEDRTPAAKADRTPAAKADRTPVAKADWTPAVPADWPPALPTDWTPAPLAAWTPAPQENRTPAKQEDWAPAPQEVHRPAPQADWAPAAKDDRRVPAAKDDLDPAAKDDLDPAAEEDWAPAADENWAPAAEDDWDSALSSERVASRLMPSILENTNPLPALPKPVLAGALPETGRSTSPRITATFATTGLSGQTKINPF
ncbi:DUF2637 domain-containing protein [Nocardia nepalensis]|uniref:DUF2637 domain-containing protein n=1 Tax=Nocardia nepalensis TaxID=3375448 RepID=UPI003B683FC2